MRIRPSAGLRALAVALAIAAGNAHANDTGREIRSLLNQGQAERALSAADRALSANPRNIDARFLRGVALAELKRPNEAIAVFRKLAEDHPGLPEPHNNLAVLYAQQRDYDKARAALEAALRTHPSYATAHANLGDLYAQMATEAYERALQLDAGRARPRPPASAPLALIRDLGAAPAPALVASAAPATRPTPVATAPAAAPVSAVAQPPATVAAPPAAVVAAAAPASTRNDQASRPAPAAPVAPAPQTSASKPATAAVVAAPAASAPAASVPAASAPPPAAARPTAQPGGQDPGQANAELQKQALATVQAWAGAWSRKDVKAYLAHYDKDFAVPDGRDRSAWEREREQRIGAPARISVEVSNPRVTIDGERATVRFQQRYRSSSFNGNTMKTLELVRRGGQWRILEERVGG